MNSWDTSVQQGNANALAYANKPDWFEALMPLAAAPLIVLLLLIFPVFILAAESLFSPVYEFINALLLPVNSGMNYAGLPPLLLIKIALFCLFTFTGLTMLLLKISCLYHEVWSYFFQKPHPLHVAYHPDQQASMVSLFNWNLFRWYQVLGPLLGWIGLSIIVGCIGFWLFNAFTGFGFLTFQLLISLGFFVMSVLGFFTFLQVFKTIWEAFTSVLGDVAAITEPEKPAQVLYERARKIALLSPWAWLLYPVYGLFYIGLLTQVIILLMRYDIQDLLTFQVDFGLILTLELVTFSLYILLSAMKMMAYHDALGRYYDNHVPA